MSYKKGTKEYRHANDRYIEKQRKQRRMQQELMRKLEREIGMTNSSKEDNGFRRK